MHADTSTHQIMSMSVPILSETVPNPRDWNSQSALPEVQGGVPLDLWLSILLQRIESLKPYVKEELLLLLFMRSVTLA